MSSRLPSSDFPEAIKNIFKHDSFQRMMQKNIEELAGCHPSTVCNPGNESGEVNLPFPLLPTLACDSSPRQIRFWRPDTPFLRLPARKLQTSLNGDPKFLVERMHEIDSFNVILFVKEYLTPLCAKNSQTPASL